MVVLAVVVVAAWAGFIALSESARRGSYAASTGALFEEAILLMFAGLLREHSPGRGGLVVAVFG